MNAKRNFFLLIGAIGLGILISALAFYWLNGRLNERATVLSKLKADIDAVDVRIAEAQSTLAQFEDLKFIDAIASDVLPPNKVQSDLVQELYQLSRQAGVTVRSISFEATGGTQVNNPSLSQTKPLDGVSGVFTLPTHISYESGTYNQFLKFLSNLEINRRKLQISRLNVSPIKEPIPGGGGATRIVGYQGQIELNVYVRPL